MTRLKNIQTEELIQRFNSELPKYLQFVKEFKEVLDKMNLVRQELSLIREELLSRNVDVDADENKQIEK